MLDKGSHWTDFYHHRLLLPVCYLYKGNHIVCSLLCLAVLTEHYTCDVILIHPCSAFSRSSSFFFHCFSQWNKYNQNYLSTIVDILELFLVFFLGGGGWVLLQIILLLIFLYVSFGKHTYAFLLDTYLRKELLGHTFTL